MRLGIMQPYFFPYIGYYQLIRAVDKFILLDDVHFINRGWINRNRIVVNNQVHLFTIPLEKASQNRLLRDIKTSDAYNWQKKLLRTVTFSYKKAPIYSSVFPIIEDIILNKERNLSEYLYYSLTKVLSYLNVNTTLKSSSIVYNNSHLKGWERIIDICQKEKASVYVNSIGGKGLYDRERFADKKIELFFIKTNFSKQTANSYNALSMIDLLMNYSKEDVKAMLLDYELE